MNPVVWVHLAAAVAAGILAVPLVRGKVKMNPYYGVRIPEAFASEARWLEINRYGGKLLFGWAVAIGITAVVGMFVPRQHWIAYNWTAGVVIVVGLIAMAVEIYRYVDRTPPQPPEEN